MPAHELRRQIGYVIQHAGLFPHRTIVDNVATVPLLLGRDKKQARARAMELLERVGLDAGVRQALPGPALRRPAAAGRRRPGARRRPAGDADGRAVQRRRPGRPRPAAGRVPPAAGRARQDDRVRHPRHRRGDQARRPGRRAAGRRQAGPARHRRPSCSPHPVDAFVAGFVGRDRGYRALGFARAGDAADARGADRPARASAAARPAARGRLGARRRRRRPARRAGSTSRAAARGLAGQRTDAAPGRHAGHPGRRPLRAALDAALSSPSGRGVVVDDGRPAARLGHGARGARPDRGRRATRRPPRRTPDRPTSRWSTRRRGA